MIPDLLASPINCLHLEDHSEFLSTGAPWKGGGAGLFSGVWWFLFKALCPEGLALPWPRAAGSWLVLTLLSVCTGVSHSGFFCPRSELCGVKGNPWVPCLPSNSGTCLVPPPLSLHSWVSYLKLKKEERAKAHPVHPRARRCLCFQTRLFLLGTASPHRPIFYTFCH